MINWITFRDQELGSSFDVFETGNSIKFLACRQSRYRSGLTLVFSG